MARATTCARDRNIGEFVIHKEWYVFDSPYEFVIIIKTCTLVLMHFNLWTHDGVIKWKYFPRYWPLVRGIHRSPTRSFDVFFELRLNKRLSKQSWGWWFETPSHPLCPHCNEYPVRINNCGSTIQVPRPAHHSAYRCLRTKRSKSVSCLMLSSTNY